MKNLVLVVAALMMFISGCTTPSERNRFQLEAANEICSVSALAEEKQSLLSSSNEKRRSLAAHQNKYGTYTQETQTILAQKLGAYDAEVEATYRMVTQSCTAYNRCLERNGHKENQCLRTESLWTQSQQRFSSLSVDLKIIEAELERDRIKAASKRRAHHHKRHHPRKEKCCGHKECCARGYECCERGYRCCDTGRICDGRRCERSHYQPPRPPVSCCDTVNTIFTDCCTR
ncbi:MAG: hypothetical protein AAFR20_10445 [Pseudomonadota bacterium]